MGDDFYSWMNRQNAPTATDSVAMDARKLPPGMTLSDHKKVCKAKPGECPYEEHNAKGEEADTLTAPPTASSPRQRRKSAASALQPPTQAELFDTFQREGVTNRLMDLTERFHAAVLTGKAKPKRLPNDAFTNDGGKMPMWLLGAYYTASNAHDDATAKQVLSAFAKKAGCYIEDATATCEDRYGNPISENSMESTVYDHGATVVKESTFGFGSDGMLQKIERLILGNRYFPETGYTPIGFGNAAAGIDQPVFLLEQPKVQYDQSNPLTDDEIQAWMKTRGFEPNPEQPYAYQTEWGDLACLDCHNENVIRTNDGRIVNIDPGVIPNTEDVGLDGYYDYENPPEHFQ